MNQDKLVAEWCGLHYGHNFDTMSAELKSEWRSRYAQAHATVPDSVGSRMFAMLDSEAIILIPDSDTYEAAFAKEPSNTHWVFTEEGLRKFVAAAQAVLEA